MDTDQALPARLGGFFLVILWLQMKALILVHVIVTFNMYNSCRLILGH